MSAPCIFWTVDDINKAAGFAATRCRDPLLPYVERYEIAWGEIACEVAQDPDRDWIDYVAAGQAAILHESRQWRRSHGEADNELGHAVYWQPITDTAVEKLLDSLALRDVACRMSAESVSTLLVQAGATNQLEAAERAGVSARTWGIRLRLARAEWFELHFDWEAPPPVPRAGFGNRGSRATHCKRGHEYTPENTRVRRSGSGREKRDCRTCQRERREAA